jgi:predicted HicB family RNase H-like nuclease
MMIHKGYIGKVEFDADARVLHGEVVGIRDVVTFRADDVAGIEKAFRDSVDDYLAFCKERGEDPEKPASGKFVVRTDPELHRKLSAIAEATDKSLNALVTEYLSREATLELSRMTAVAGEKAAPMKTTRAQSAQRDRKPVGT